MLTIITPRERRVEQWYELTFDDGHHNGFGFPCDADGNVAPDLLPAAKENLEWAKAHPENFDRYNEVVKHETSYIEPAHGICRCGHEVVLEDIYYGACQCEHCGQWYNLFGQELVDPKYWEDDPSEVDVGW